MMDETPRNRENQNKSNQQLFEETSSYEKDVAYGENSAYGADTSYEEDISQESDASVLEQRVIDENRPVRDRSEQKEKDLRTMNVSEILHDEDWEDYDEEDLDEPYHHHVRKEWRPREHRLWVRFLTKFLILAAIIGSFCFVFLYGFRLRQVTITGNYTYSDEEILNFLHYNEYPKNTLFFGWKNKDDITDGIAFIERISVRISGPSSVSVTVQEKMIIGCIDDSGVYMFFDNTGAVVESSTSKPDDVPLVTGLNLSGLHIGDQLNLNDKSVFNNLYELSVYLKNYEVTVEQIDYNEDQSMVMHKGNISILLGVGTNLEDKISAFKDLEPYLEDLSGTLHLEDYDSSKDHINFSKE